MEYNQPVGKPVDDPYVTGTAGPPAVEGSIPPGESIEYPQREIVDVIEHAGLTPDNGDLTQLRQAILAIVLSDFAKGADIASADPLVIGTDGKYFAVTGSTDFAGMTVAAGRTFVLRPPAGLTITVGSGIALNNGGGNYVTQAGDLIVCYSTAADTVAGFVIGASSAKMLLQGLRELDLPATFLRPRESNGCAPIATLETVTNAVNQRYLAFDPSTPEYAQCTLTLEKGWDGGPIQFRYRHSHTATATNFGVTYGLAGRSFADDEALDQAFGSAVNVSDTGGETDRNYWSAWSGDVTVAGAAPGEAVTFQFGRVPSDGGDTLAVDSRIHDLQIRYTVDKANDQ